MKNALKFKNIRKFQKPQKKLENSKIQKNLKTFENPKKKNEKIGVMHFIWVLLPVSQYIHFCEDCARSFDKLLRALVGFDMSRCS